jgi:hypothetical protein
MDEITFDALTRSVVTEAGSRRAVVRFLAGTVLGAIATRLGPAEGAAAKAKSHKGQPKRTHQESGHSSHKRRDQAHSHQKGEQRVQPEGKHKGKGKKGNRHHNAPQSSPPLAPLPPGCESCTACQMCQDGACVADPDLAGVPCEGSGAGCNYCYLGQCIADEQPPCDDGTCAHRGTCCPGRKYCSDPGSRLGFFCTDPTACCDDEKKCGDQCVPRTYCCELDPVPLCSDFCARLGCVNGEWKCVPLPDGTTCLRSSGPDGKCCQGACSMEEIICPAYPWRHYNPQTCRCECNDGLVDCPGGYQNRPCCEPF